MRSRDLIKLVSSETGIPDYSDPERVVWYNSAGLFHRDFGPAIVSSDGTRQWFKDGVLHREDGPAVTWANGRQEWLQNDQLHRKDGPAVVRPDGTEEWWVNGNFIR